MLTKASLTIFPLLAGISFASPLSAQTINPTTDHSRMAMMGQELSPGSTMQALTFQQKLLALGTSPGENPSPLSLSAVAADSGLTALIDTTNTLLLYSPEASILASLELLSSENSLNEGLSINAEAISSGEILATLSETANPAESPALPALVNTGENTRVGDATKIGVMLDHLAVKKRSLKENLVNPVEDQIVAQVLSPAEPVSEAIESVPTAETTAISSTPTVSESPVNLSQPPLQTAQAGTMTAEPTLPELQQQLFIEPIIVAGVEPTYPPSLTFGIPSGFGPGWGDLYISASGATAGKARDGQVDGSISTGFGLGDPVNLIGLSFTYNLGSINNFGSNGTFDMAASRLVYADAITSVGVAAGWSAFGQYGNEGVIPSTVWGTVTSYSYLQPDDPINKLPLLLSVGVGGGYYRQDPASTGVFGGVGLQVAPQLGLGLQWSGVGLNFGLSFVPVPTIPLTLQAMGADLTDNSPGGTRFILSLSYGFNFLPPGAR